MTKLTPRDKRLRKTYGITEAQYKNLLRVGGGGCWICARQPKPGRNLCVDHVHKKGGGGQIRGLLCFFCNRRLIGRHKDPQLFQLAAAYLSVGTGLFTPLRAAKRKRRAAR